MGKIEKKGLKIKKNKSKRLISPIKFAFYFLILWVVGVLLGVGINMIITRYILFDTKIQYSLLVIAFVVASAIIGMPLAYLISNKVAIIINSPHPLFPR